MKHYTLFAVLAVVALIFCVSCSSTKVYAPISVDLTEQTKPVFEQRPDNTKLEVIENPVDIWDYIYNGETYLYAWLSWQSYAESLENLIISIEDSLKPS